MMRYIDIMFAGMLLLAGSGHSGASTPRPEPNYADSMRIVGKEYRAMKDTVILLQVKVDQKEMNYE